MRTLQPYMPSAAMVTASLFFVQTALPRHMIFWQQRGLKLAAPKAAALCVTAELCSMPAQACNKHSNALCMHPSCSLVAPHQLKHNCVVLFAAAGQASRSCTAQERELTLQNPTAIAAPNTSWNTIAFGRSAAVMPWSCTMPDVQIVSVIFNEHTVLQRCHNAMHECMKVTAAAPANVASDDPCPQR